MTARKPWSFAAGQKGRPFRVTVFENPQREWVLMLRWMVETSDGPKRRTESLGRSLRTKDGKIIREVERWAKAQAQQKHEALLRGELEAAAVHEPAPLTIGESAAKLTDPKTGKYPTPSQHRKETLNAVVFAAIIWGSERAWNTIGKADIRALGRARVDELRRDGHEGLAGAEHTMRRVFTVAQWLRDEELIDPGACVPPKNWKEEIRTYWVAAAGARELPKPKRPRYTIGEALKIVEAAASIDPRLHLMLWLAPNQRLGQVARVHRSNVDLAKNEIRIPTRGNKKGAVIEMTAAERAVLDMALSVGYLRELEAAYSRKEIADYPLFPAGQLPGIRTMRGILPTNAGPAPKRDPRTPEFPVARVARHANAKAVRKDAIGGWFEMAEAKAGIQKQEGRGPYGVRRAFVDAGKELKISREGLTALGGWADPQMADRIYAEEEKQYARREARDVRARIRGEEGAGD